MWSTILHTCGPSEPSQELNNVLEYLNDWAVTNKMRFNVKKTKEMVFNFSRYNNTPPPMLLLNGNEVEQVSESKILGVVLQSDLKWNAHVTMITKKANKRLHLLRLCKKAGVIPTDLVMIYTSIVRSVLEYCCVVWHPSLPNYLQIEVERIQKRALAIIYPHIDYEQSLQKSKLKTLFERREVQCKKVFINMQKASHELHNLLPTLTYDFHSFVFHSFIYSSYQYIAYNE